VKGFSRTLPFLTALVAVFLFLAPREGRLSPQCGCCSFVLLLGRLAGRLFPLFKRLRKYFYRLALVHWSLWGVSAFLSLSPRPFRSRAPAKLACAGSGVVAPCPESLWLVCCFFDGVTDLAGSAAHSPPLRHPSRRSPSGTRRARTSSFTLPLFISANDCSHRRLRPPHPSSRIGIGGEQSSRSLTAAR